MESINKNNSAYTEIYTWGYDIFGLNKEKEKKKENHIPKHFSFDIVIESISCGLHHIVFNTNSGNVYSLGSNENGILGIDDNNIEFSHSPCLVESLTNAKVIKITCGYKHTLALSEDGNVFGWGNNSYSQVSQEETLSKLKPTQVSVNHLKNEGFSHFIKNIYTNANHNFLLNDQGKLFGFGRSDSGQLGLGENLIEKIPKNLKIDEEILNVAAGVSHTIFLTGSNNLFCFGFNNHGQLGLGHRKNMYFPILNHNFQKLPDENDGKKTNNNKEDGKNLEKNEKSLKKKEAKNNADLTILNETINKDNTYRIAKIFACEFSALLMTNGDFFLWGPTLFSDELIPKQITLEQIYNNNKNLCGDHKNLIVKTDSKTEFIDCSLGKDFFILLDNKNNIYGWGGNSEGVLGFGENCNYRDKLCLIDAVKSKTIKKINCGQNYVVLLSNDVSNSKLDKEKSNQILKDELVVGTIRNQDVPKKRNNFSYHFGEKMRDPSFLQEGIIANMNKDNLKHLTSEEIRKRQKSSLHISPKKKEIVFETGTLTTRININNNNNYVINDPKKFFNNKKVEIKSVFPEKVQDSKKAKENLKIILQNNLERSEPFESDETNKMKSKVEFSDNHVSELDNLRVQQNELIINYSFLEKKYLDLEELYQQEMGKKSELLKEIEKLNSKINEKEEDVKYLKTQNLKSQNYFDENMEKLKKYYEDRIKILEERKSYRNSEQLLKDLTLLQQDSQERERKFKQEKDYFNKNIKILEQKIFNLEFSNNEKDKELTILKSKIDKENDSILKGPKNNNLLSPILKNFTSITSNYAIMKSEKENHAFLEKDNEMFSSNILEIKNKLNNLKRSKSYLQQKMIIFEKETERIIEKKI